jgi:sporulation protein YlmC with PRC-barrel domain
VRALRFSHLIGSRVVDTEGARLGHVFDVHVEPDGARLRLTHLLVGRAGLAARLSLDVSWRLAGEEVPWERVVELEPGRVVVRAGGERETKGRP